MDARTDALVTVPTIHADGIWFGLDKQEYHDDPALGSSDMAKLAFSPCDYWYGSWMNPRRPPDRSTPAQATGTALHVLILEGEAAFDARYMRGPDQDEDAKPSEKAAATKEAKALAAKRSLEMIPAEDYDRLAIAGAMITRNPKLSRAFSGGASEVSVFWTETGKHIDMVDPKSGEVTRSPLPIRKKARIDYLKPRGLGDLKKVANQHQVPFPRACVNAIVNYNMHVQAGHYLDARAHLPQLLRDGMVHGDHDPELIKGILAAPSFAWQWVFWQGERAPLTWSRVLSPKNPIVELAQTVLARADVNYLDYMGRFGPGQIWLDVAEPKELFIEDLPSWFARD